LAGYFQESYKSKGERGTSVKKSSKGNNPKIKPIYYEAFLAYAGFKNFRP
jgi:hypothetical protein